MNKIVMIGGGGHCRSCISVVESARQFQCLGVIDDELDLGSEVMGHPVLGGDDCIEALVDQGVMFHVAIGFLGGESLAKMRVFNKLNDDQVHLPKIISANAIVASGAILGSGVSVHHKAVVNSCATIGDNVIVNTGAIVEHDSRIGSHSHVSTGAVVNGGVHVGERCLVGSGSVIKHGVKITDDVVIGAGAVVVKDIVESGVYVGVPARRINAG